MNNGEIPNLFAYFKIANVVYQNSKINPRGWTYSEKN